MILELLAIGVALDANSNAERASEVAQDAANTANGLRVSGPQFLFFEDIDYYCEEKSGFFSHGFVNGGRRVTKTSLPVSSIKSITEETPSSWYGSEYVNQRERLRMFHKGAVTVIQTHGKDKYYLDCSIEEFNNKLSGKV